MADLPNKPNKPLESKPVVSEVATEEGNIRPVEPAVEREPRTETVREEPEREIPAEKPSRNVPREAPSPAAPIRTAAVVPAKDPMTAKIEDVLSEDLTDAFLSMPPETQEAFKIKGEETATKIRELFEQAKVNARKVFGLIREWLKMIPGVNRFFLEQEAKIKTDKILRLKP